MKKNGKEDQDFWKEEDFVMFSFVFVIKIQIFKKISSLLNCRTMNKNLFGLCIR